MAHPFFGRFLMLASASLLLFACDPVTSDPENENGKENNENNNQNQGGDVQGSVEISWINTATEYSLASDNDTVLADFSVWEGQEYQLEWTAQTSDSWITVTPSSGTGGCEITIAVAPNETASVRTGSVTIKCKDSSSSLSITQSLFGGAMPDEEWFSTNYWDRTDREKAGLRGPVKSWYEDHYTTYHKYYYDEAGHLIKDEYHDVSDNTVRVDWNYEYDDQGHLISAVSGDGFFSFTYEYENPGKYVATDPYIWVPIYISGNSFPLSIIKDLSAIHYVDRTGVIYNVTNDYTYQFDEAGTLTIISEYRNESQPDVYCDTSTVAYRNGYPVSSVVGGTQVTYASNGMPLTLSRNNGEITFSFVPNDIKLLIERMDEPEASGMVAEFWATYQYNKNGDITRRDHAYFSPDQEYLDTYDRYFYDSYGNWILRDETIEPAFQQGQRTPCENGRTIEYYE